MLNPLDYTVCLSPPARVGAGGGRAAPFVMFLTDLVRPRLVVELGTAGGATYCAFCQAVEEVGLDARCVGVALGRDGIEDDLTRHHDARYRDFSTLLRAETDAAALAQFEDGAIDLLHLSGHRADGAARDFDGWLRKLSRRGLVMLSGTREYGSEIRALWERLKPAYAHVELGLEGGLGLVAAGELEPEGLRRLLLAPADEAAALEAFFERLGESAHARAADEEREASAAEAEAKASQLEAILNSRAWRWVSRYGRAKNALLRPARRLKGLRSSAPADGSFSCGLDTRLPETLTVGKGNALYLAGWLHHPAQKIKGLDLVLGDERHPVKFYGARRGSFWAFLPLKEIERPVSSELYLEAALASGETRRGRLATLRLEPGPARVRPKAKAPGAPLVAVCMATYNPPPELFRRQVESIRAQTHRRWVCVISDDCSDAQAVEEMRRVINGDERFRLHLASERAGFYHNFERALRLAPAEADYVALSDQDDYWHADKLEALLAEFEDDTTLVYSDMNIVDARGERLASTYWTTRPNNYEDFASLLVANTITGAASMFRRGLIDYLLPFPEKIGAPFHDHWIGCAALALGRVKYVPRPLYDYVQHGGNALGHFAPPREKFWRKVGAGLRGAARLPSAARARLAEGRAVYFYDLMRIQLACRVLELRCGERLSGEKRRSLRRIARADESFAASLWLAARGLRSVGRTTETLGAENLLLKAVLWKKTLGARQGHLGAAAADARLTAATAPHANGDGVARAFGQIEVARQKIEPLSLAVSRDAPRRVNLLIPTIDLKYFFGGYITKLNLARHLCEAGHRVRLVIVDHCEYRPALWRRQLRAFEGLEGLLDRVELAYSFDRTIPLEVSPRDAFVATTWWTAHIARRAATELGRRRFVYLIQEYEPFTFPMGTFASLAAQTYNFAHAAVFSTELLRDYFRQNSLGVYAGGVNGAGDASSVAFENCITRVGPISLEDLAARRPRKLLLYARPEPHAARNMFELAVMALARAVEAGHFAGEWEFYGVGTIGTTARVPLARGASLSLLPRLTQAAYRDVLRSHDLGLSLMYTPHPSLVPIEMASAGMLVVTNTYANKTAAALRSISPNIIAAEPTVEAVALALKEAATSVTDYERRVGGSRVRWSTTWDESFNERVMARVCQFLESDAAC